MKPKLHLSFRSGHSSSLHLAALTLCLGLSAPARAGTGSALAFDGTNNYVRVTDRAALRLSSAFSAECWVKTPAQHTNAVLMAKYDEDADQRGWMLTSGETGNPDHLWVVLAAQGAAGPNNLTWDTGLIFDTNTWYHLALTHDASLPSANVKVYVDGALRAQTDWAHPVFPSTADLLIGGYDGPGNGLNMGANSRFFGGQVDEVRIWNVALSATDVQGRMNQTLNGTEPGLVACYRFDEGIGAKVYDSTANHLDGGLVHTPAWVWMGATVPYPVTLTADGFTPNAATLHGLVTPNEQQTTAWFEWGTTTNYGTSTPVPSPGNGRTAVPVSLSISGLAANVTYHYRVVGSNNLSVVYGTDRSLAIVTASTLADGGPGSLREAIAIAVPGTTILLTNTGRITLTNGELSLTKDLAIVGPGASALAISGNNSSRVFNIAPNVTASISLLTISDGHAPDGQNGATTGASGLPGAHGGGIYNAGSLTLNACVLTNNRAGTGGRGGDGYTGSPSANGGSAGSGGTGGRGGAIHSLSSAELYLDQCTISGNFSGTGGSGGTGGHGGTYKTFSGPGSGGPAGVGGAAGPGAGIFNEGVATLSRCTISGNSNGAGGNGGNGGEGGDAAAVGIFTGGTGNVGGVGGTGGDGGGVYGNGQMTLNHCTITGNRNGQGGAGGRGGNAGSGGLSLWGAGGNGGAGGSGGGLCNINTAAMQLLACTLAYDAAGAGGPGGPHGSGWFGDPDGSAGPAGHGGGIANGGAASLCNTIVAANTRPASVADDVFGTVISLGHNLIGNTIGGSGFATNDLLNVHPLLGPLADNGGPTRTHTPLPGSPAINAGDNSYASVTDQRGLPRVAGGTVDIGAVEIQYWPVATTLPTSGVSATSTVARATLHGTVNPGGPSATVAWFEWLDGVARHQTSPMEVGSGTGNFAVAADLSGLTAGVTYRYRLVTANFFGFDYGAELRFSAPKLAADPLIWICHDDYVEPGISVTASPMIIAAGASHNLALMPDGMITGWGANGDGQISIPVGLSNVTGIAGGFYHSLALRADGTVLGWGGNGMGQTNTPGGLSDVVAVAAGSAHSLALKADGTVTGWGLSSSGQTTNRSGLNDAKAIAAGGEFSLALKADGTVVGWGNNTRGQLNCPAGLNNVIAIAAGEYHGLALKADGTVVTWGDNTYRQTSNPAGLNNVVAVAAGEFHSLALKADGTVLSWGRNNYLQTNTPPGLNHVTAIAAGSEHSLALKADGTVVVWGSNPSGQNSAPVGLNDLNLAVGSAGTVDVNVPGPYVLTYTTTDSFGATGTTTRTVQVIPATPLVSTQPATDVSSTGATWNAVVNPRGAETLTWVEYGLTTKYGNDTASTNLGSYPYHIGIHMPVTNLLPWMTYHFRAVGSNNVGRINGPDLTVTLPGPFGPGTEPWVSELADVTVLQGGNTTIPFTACPAGVNLRVGCNNPVLLPDAGISLTSLGTNRWLHLVPATNHSGSAQVTVTASDGMHAVRRVFTLTVTPLFASSSLHLTNAHRISGETWRFRIVDLGTASTNYVVEYRSGLASLAPWMVATNVTWPGSDVVEVHAGPSQSPAGFYRVKGIRWLTAGLDSPGFTMEEGSARGAVVIFSGLYNGPLSYTWGGTQGTNTGTIQVNGTTAFIPIPAGLVSDNTEIEQLKYLTVRLAPANGFALAGTIESSITVEENDASWQGTLVIPNGMAATATALLTNYPGTGRTNLTLPQNADLTLAFMLKIQQTNGSLQGQLLSDSYGFFPTNALAQATLTDNRFTAVATQIPLPSLADSPLFATPSHLDLRLDADNAQTNQSVGSGQISGLATLVSVVPGRPYLDSSISGRFLLLKTATVAPTNEVPLTPVP